MEPAAPSADELADLGDPATLLDDDDQLRLVFLCCHPALAEQAQVALTLRTVGGLTTTEIARAFLVPESTMAQRLVRAKRKIVGAGIPFRLPEGDELAERTAAVLHVVYLVFNEGYAASEAIDDAPLVRVDLCEEALRLSALLRRLLPDDAEVTGLCALLLLHDARRATRTDEAGRLVPIAEQDRAPLGPGADPPRGRAGRAGAADRTGGAVPDRGVDRGPARGGADVRDDRLAADRRPVRAAGAGAPRTDGPAQPGSRGSMVEGPLAGLAVVDELVAEGELAEHHRLYAVRAHLLEEAGRPDEAVAAYERAAELSTSTPERDYLRMRRDQLLR